MRLKHDGLNDVFRVKHTSPIKYAAEILSDLTSILLISTAFIASQFENQVSAAVICVILIISCVLEAVTYIKAQNVLESAAAYGIPRAKVIRGGQMITIDCRRLVRGDILILEQGDIVTCDARILSENDLTKNKSVLKVAETGITSNEYAVIKKACTLPESPILPPDKQKNMLFAGTTIISGSCRAVAVDTGEDTLAFIRTDGISLLNHEKLPLLKKLKEYCRNVSLAMIAAVMIITVLDMAIGLRDRGISQVFLTGMSLAVASMSEFFASIGYIIIACGVVGAGGKNKSIVIKNVMSVENMSGIDCIIMRDDSALRSHTVKFSAFYTDNEISYDEKSPDLAKLIYFALLSTGNTNIKYLDNKAEQTQDEILLRYFAKRILNNSHDLPKYTILEHCHNEGSSKYETALALGQDRLEVFVRGNPAQILADCTSYAYKGECIKMTPDMRQKIFEKAAMMQLSSCNVIAVARRDSDFNTLRKISVIQSELCFEGFIVFEEPLVAGAEKAIESCTKAGIQLILLVDDTNNLGRIFAQSKGFLENGHDFVTVDEFRAFDDDLLMSRCLSIGTGAGFKNRDILRLVEFLKKNGKTVGYIGGSPDDARIVYEADIGFACVKPPSKKNKSKSDKSKNENYHHSLNRNTDYESVRINSDVLIRESAVQYGGFVDAVKAISYAKSIFINISHAASYLVTSQTARITLVLFAVLFGMNIMSAPQILLWGLILDFMAVLLFAFEKPSKNILFEDVYRENEIFKVSKLVRPILFGFLWAFLVASLPQILSIFDYTIPETELSSFVFVASVFAVMVCATESMKESTIFSKGNYFNTVYLSFILIIIYIIISCVFGGFVYKFILSGDKLYYINAAISFIPSVILFVMYEVIKKISK